MCIQADLERADDDGDTPLMVAAAGGFDDVVGYLLEKGADSGRQSKVNYGGFRCGDEWGGVMGIYCPSRRSDLCTSSPLSNLFSMTHNHFYSFPSTYGTNQGGKTALHWAARHGEKRACKVLLQAGADVSVVVLCIYVYVYGLPACLPSCGA